MKDASYVYRELAISKAEPQNVDYVKSFQGTVYFGHKTILQDLHHIEAVVHMKGEKHTKFIVGITTGNTYRTCAIHAMQLMHSTMGMC